MDLNLAVLGGRLAAPPEIQRLESGRTVVRYLVTVRSDVPRRRVDVLPVVEWLDPDRSDRYPATAFAGQRVWVAGSVQRRFWQGNAARSSRLELVAQSVEIRPAEAGTEVRARG